MAFKVRSLLVSMGPIQVVDVSVERIAANQMGIGADDYLDLSRGTAQLVVNNANAALATAQFSARNGAIVARTVSGTPAIGVRLNGTVYYFLRDGTVGT